MMMNYNIMDLAMNNNNNNNNSSGCSWPPESKPLNLHNHHIPIIPSLLANYKLNDVGRYKGNMVSDEMAVKAKIMAHPLFTRLLTSYVNCQKVGAPSEVVARLEQVSEGNMGILRLKNGSGNIGEEPALDQFMEAYCEMLAKYEEELTKPFREAMLFLSTIDSQLKALTVCEDFVGQNGSYLEEELDVKGSPVEPQAEDEELKVQLLRKYSGYLGSLKQEFMKKKKSGKLPKEARQRLLDWWTKHYKWPYPSEAQKVALAETTGLDLKQINNWFINQRKRHWKPSEELHFMVALDPALPAGHTYYNMVNNNNNNNIIIYNPFSMDLL